MEEEKKKERMSSTKKAEKIVLRTVRALKAFDGTYFKFRIPYEVDSDDVVVTINGEKLKRENVGFVMEYGKPKLDLTFDDELIKDGKNRIVVKIKDENGKTKTNLVKKLIVNRAKIEMYVPYIYTKQTVGLDSMFHFPLSNCNETKSIDYTSSNKDVVAVSKSGVVKAKKKGSSKIKCIAKGKDGSIYKVVQTITVSEEADKVVDKKIKDIHVKCDLPIFVTSKDMQVGDVMRLDMKNVNDASIKYKSSDANVCEVSEEGVVTVKEKGKSTVTVILKKNGKTYIYKLKLICK